MVLISYVKLRKRALRGGLLVNTKKHKGCVIEFCLKRNCKQVDIIYLIIKYLFKLSPGVYNL